MQQQRTFGTFEQVVLPHLDAAYNLARWLLRGEHDAEDVVQEACLRAFNAFGQFQGGEPRSWLLTTVRNACYTWLTRNRQRAPTASFDEALHDVATDTSNPEIILQQRSDREAVKQAIATFHEHGSEPRFSSHKIGALTNTIMGLRSLLVAPATRFPITKS